MADLRAEELDSHAHPGYYSRVSFGASGGTSGEKGIRGLSQC